MPMVISAAQQSRPTVILTPLKFEQTLLNINRLWHICYHSSNLTFCFVKIGTQEINKIAQCECRRRTNIADETG